MDRKRRAAPGGKIGLLVLALVLFLPDRGWGAAFRIEPGIAVSEEYNDNIFLTRRNRKDDFITSIIPSIHATYEAPFWDWDLLYAYNYRFLAKEPVSNEDTSNHTVTLINHNRIISEFLFLDVKEEYNRVSLDITRDYTKESLFVNLTDRNILTINPYIALRPGSLTTVRIGYTYLDTQYRDPFGIDKTDNIVYAEMKMEATPKTEITAGARYTEDTNRVQDYNRRDVYAGWRYEYAEKSSVYFTIGHSAFDFSFFGESSQFLGSAGLTHVFPKFAVSFEAGQSYVEDPTRSLRREDRFVSGITTEAGRTKLGFALGVREYRSAETSHLEDTRYDVTGTIAYELTARATALFDITFERVDDERLDTRTDLYFAGGRLEYLASEKCTLSFDYRYGRSYTPQVPSGGYNNNRFIVAVKKFF